jgi:hypothetical protein
MSRTATLTGTPADLIGYQSELVRTKNCLPLGRMNKIAIGPSADWTPNLADPFIAKFGRLIDLRNRFLPIASSPDRSMLLITAPLLVRSIETNAVAVGLPDVPDPTGRAVPWSDDEVCGRVDRDPAKDRPRMIPQRLEDRAECPNGRLGTLEGTNFLVFQPVLRIVYQPEIMEDGVSKLQAAMWTINCIDEFGGLLVDEAGRSACLIIDPKTGEAHFIGGQYNIVPTE